MNDRERFPLLQETEIGRRKLFQFLQDLIISFCLSRIKPMMISNINLRSMFEMNVDNYLS